MSLRARAGVAGAVEMLSLDSGGAVPQTPALGPNSPTVWSAGHDTALDPEWSQALHEPDVNQLTTPLENCRLSRMREGSISDPLCCVLCIKRTEHPQVLPCLHSVCSTCVLHSPSGGLRCPVCSKAENGTARGDAFVTANSSLISNVLDIFGDESVSTASFPTMLSPRDFVNTFEGNMMHIQKNPF